ncbi:MBL fold metallo-hydrolase [Labrys wisconsinensis]|uniref:L-ascorbate metabolism protein UlaG (Beta-lactamase superfamily) n=1 Tax=Labrys wisconsinensis TaxID=425677 RepID=A0ABU0JL58_9HYPH|nr:MBL fold metallo-hydrolase [Labrys wisconsinensis]MDQ0475032.1 L-ascorbate metabolism protein UlaG (beta-lactamase superfamily) [Labrys wisconsinensis]
MPTRRDALLTLSGFAACTLLPGFAMPDALAATAALRGDTIPTAAGDVVIHPVNHASLFLGFKDQVIAIDPVGGGARYAGLPKPTAILLTHAHPDHFDLPTLEALGVAELGLTGPKVVLDGLPDGLRAKARLAANGDSGEIAGVAFTAVPAYNTTPDRLKYHPKGVGNGYVISFGDKKIYIAGDTEDIPEMRALTGIEVAFLPMNLPYTMTEEQAASAVEAFRPRIVYPYHYKGSDPKKFAALVGDAAQVRLLDWYAS